MFTTSFSAPTSRPTCDVEREINFLADLKEDPVGDKPELVEKLRRKKLVTQEALTEWTEQVKVLEGKVSRRTKRVDSLTNEIYQLVGLYSVFVGVVFSAVQSDRVHCQHIWSPILLCLLPCVIIVHIIDKKLTNIRRIREEITEDESSRRVHLKNLKILKSKSYKEFDFSKDVLEGKKIANDHTGITKRGVINILLFSSAVIVGSFLHILCFTKSLGCDGDYAPGRILPY